MVSRIAAVVITAGALTLGLGCRSSTPKATNDTVSASAASPAADQSASTTVATAKRNDLFVRALATVRHPAAYRLDDDPISGDSLLAAVRSGHVVNVTVFTGSPGTQAMVNADGPRRAGDISCYGAFDQAGMPATIPGEDHEDAAVLFRGSCNVKKARDASTLYRVGRDSLMTESQIRARTAGGSPIYLIDDSLATEPAALALLGQGAAGGPGRRAFTIFTEFAENPADGGVVEIGTRMPVGASRSDQP